MAGLDREGWPGHRPLGQPPGRADSQHRAASPHRDVAASFAESLPESRVMLAPTVAQFADHLDAGAGERRRSGGTVPHRRQHHGQLSGPLWALGQPGGHHPRSTARHPAGQPASPDPLPGADRPRRPHRVRQGRGPGTRHPLLQVFTSIIDTAAMPHSVAGAPPLHRSAAAPRFTGQPWIPGFPDPLSSGQDGHPSEASPNTGHPLRTYSIRVNCTYRASFTRRNRHEIPPPETPHHHCLQPPHRPPGTRPITELRAADQGGGRPSGVGPRRQHPPRLRTQWRFFTGWCVEVGLTSLPAEPLAVAHYLRAPAPASPLCGWPPPPSRRPTNVPSWNRPVVSQACAPP